MHECMYRNNQCMIGESAMHSLQHNDSQSRASPKSHLTFCLEQHAWYMQHATQKNIRMKSGIIDATMYFQAVDLICSNRVCNIHLLRFDHLFILLSCFRMMEFYKAFLCCFSLALLLYTVTYLEPRWMSRRRALHHSKRKIHSK
jgi:hypothetical protein